MPAFTLLAIGLATALAVCLAAHFRRKPLMFEIRNNEETKP